jgi:N utilization substance protein B
MKLSRSQKRECTFLLLFQQSFNDDAIDEIVQANIDEFGMLTDASVTAAVLAVQANLSNADEIINKYSKTRKVGRIAKVTAAILRLALFEMDCISEEEVPDKAAINEAIELAKKYAGEVDAKFVSAILGSYYREKHGE